MKENIRDNSYANGDVVSRRAFLGTTLAGGAALFGPLHGIPVLVKDNIATDDKMQTTAGSLSP